MDSLIVILHNLISEQLYFSLLINKKEFFVYNEYQTSGGYADLLLLKQSDICKYNIMIEFKYLKVKEYNKKILAQKREEAKLQLESYSKDERLNISILRKHIVIFVGNNLKVLEEV